MDDNPDSTCKDNLKVRNTWSSSGDQLAITTAGDRLGTTTHQMGGGYDISASSGCRITGNGFSCEPSLTGVWVTTNDQTASKTWDIEWCGDGETRCGEECEPPAVASCTTPAGDAGTKTCTVSCGWEECRPTCQKNEDCGAGGCCLRHSAPPEASGPLTGQTTFEASSCVSKQIYAPNQAYLCDPGTWIICDESKVGTKQEFDNRIFICIKEGSTYKWEEKTASQLHQNKNEGFSIDLPSIFSGIIKLFGIMFII